MVEMQLQRTNTHEYNNNTDGEANDGESPRLNRELSMLSLSSDSPLRGRGLVNQEAIPAGDGPLEATLHAANGGEDRHIPGAALDRQEEIQILDDTIEPYEQHIVRAEYWMQDRYRTLRKFEPTEGSERIGQIFACADRLCERNEMQPFQSLRFSIMRIGDVSASTVIRRGDEVA